MKLKNKYFGIIYDGVIKHQNIKEIHKSLYKTTINSKVVNKELFIFAEKVAKKAKSYDKGKGNYYGGSGLVVLADALTTMFNQQKINDKFKHIINHSEMEKAEKEKNNIITDTIKNNRKEGKIFYLASSHNDCAEDHKEYQGKMYVDRYWHNYDKDGSIGKYVREHQLKSIQWVMGNPVWFITRPNCRHYFESIPTDKVLKSSVKSLKKKYKTHTETGDYTLQTPRQVSLEHYRDRLAVLEELYSKYPTEKLKKQIIKTKMLIKRYLIS